MATTRNVSTGEDALEGDYLINAQGEDVVAGIRAHGAHRQAGARRCRRPSRELQRIARLLEKHYREVQDIEFTVERGTLWMLQTRDAKRTARAAVKIAVDLAKEKLITREEAVLRVTPEHVDFFLHPQFDPESMRTARPSGGCSRAASTCHRARPWDSWPSTPTPPSAGRRRRRRWCMIRAETKPDDVHGMLAARGILTSRGGRTSHAALVARQFGKPAVVGVDGAGGRRRQEGGQIKRSSVVLREGDWVVHRRHHRRGLPRRRWRRCSHRSRTAR